MSVPSTSKRMRSFSRGSAWVMAAEARSAGSDVTLTERGQHFARFLAAAALQASARLARRL